ncbi:MAG: putative DNA binding domain-containing protein [Anaerolineae bacterium]|nr:putative DNA binding domain-containing protein [Anaerolineae bacterium]
MSRLWEILEHCIESGQEARKVDLKQLVDLASPDDRAKFAKDVAAMANTSGGPGYLVIGVVDRKHRRSDDPSEYVVGFRPDDLEVFEQRMVQALENNCRPVPEIRYEEIRHPTVDRCIGVVMIPRGFSRPYTMNGQIFIRRGSHTYPAAPDEVKQVPRRILVNFARAMDSTQIKQLEELLGAEIDEIIDVPGQLQDDQPYLPQARAMISAAGLTPAEWQSLPLVVNIHPFAPGAAAVLAWLHGLRGHFPDVVRMMRNEQTGHFEVVEVLKLQSVRNEIRDWTVQL